MLIVKKRIKTDKNKYNYACIYLNLGSYTSFLSLIEICGFPFSDLISLNIIVILLLHIHIKVQMMDAMCSHL